jgi:mannose-6-phosphate isomerase-like protein (cupin superfamily)
MHDMKIFKTGEFKTMKDPTPPGKALTKIVTGEDRAKDLEGIFVVFPPIRHGRYHYHKKREGIFVIISGKASIKIDEKDYPIEAGDIIYLSAGEKHTITNESGEEFRFMEFYTNPPHEADWVEVK